ncbi:MAG TPA: four-carbon acid sugar kinase family protein [Puia sp.]|nr:four-carbon acid sugar kinase family protein [Puia sp.]
MIAVIADDLTGAAELGGIGLRHGLRTEIRTIVPEHTGAVLLVIAADSRSKPEPAAIDEMTAITHALKALQPEWIYKKTDSVLRGHVIAELKTHLGILGFESALLIPANPILGRTIQGGHYYLNGKPIHHSAFSIDPEFPIYSADIQDMLHTRQEPVQLRKPGEELPARGIIVGEVNDLTDLQTWAHRLPAHTMAAGAAGFFSALLDLHFPWKTAEPARIGAPLLFISGTTFDRSRDSIKRQKDAGGPVRYLPADPDENWINDITRLLRKENKAVIAIDPAWHNYPARELRDSMATAVYHILKRSTPAEIIIEGGATAYAILNAIGWHTFIPEQELAPGLVRMRVTEVPDLFVTVKPGSYPWPDAISI